MIKKEKERFIPTWVLRGLTLCCLALFILYFSHLFLFVIYPAEPVTFRDGFSGKVEKMDSYKGYTYVLLKDRSEYIKIDYSTNHNYQPNSLELFLKVQDSIYKKNCADVLYIKRKEKTYEFLIGDHWYNSKERSAEFIKYWHERRSIILKSAYCE